MGTLADVYELKGTLVIRKNLKIEFDVEILNPFEFK